jgi:hypothetical protein
MIVSGFAGSISADANCSACTCGNPSGAACGLPTVTFYENPSCAGPSDTLAASSGAACKNVDVQLSDYVQSVKYTSVPTTPGTCAPAGGALQAQPPTSEHEALVCNLEVVGTCQGAEPCVSAPPVSFEQGVCVYRQGTHGCPAEYPHELPIYLGHHDTRGCASCACADSTPTCTGVLGVHTSGSNCIGSATAVTKGVCMNATPGSMRWTPGAFNAGSCTASGGQLQGGVVPDGPITVCCGDV